MISAFERRVKRLESGRPGSATRAALEAEAKRLQAELDVEYGHDPEELDVAQLEKLLRESCGGRTARLWEIRQLLRTPAERRKEERMRREIAGLSDAELKEMLNNENCR